jgi:hypothetical protein
MSAPASPELIVAGLVLLLLVGLVVLRPLFRPEPEEPADDEGRASLEAAKEAKYREIRDAELDFRMGKLSEDDYRATDRELRAQAIDILKRIDAIDGRDPAAERESPGQGSGEPPTNGR